MLNADFGDILYYIIFAVVILAGLLEKVAKSKRQQQQAGAPRPAQPYDDFEDAEQPARKQAPANNLEEMMRRMLEGVETPEQQKVFYPEEAQSLEVISENAQSLEYIPLLGRHFYDQEEARIREQSGEKNISPVMMDEENESIEFQDIEFDFRQAVISSEILNRKY